MTRSVHRAERDISRVRDLPFGNARTRAAEAEVSRLDAEGPDEALDYALFTLVEAYTFSEEAVKAFVPFTRMLRLFDEHPEYFDEYDAHSVYWAYKWMVGDLMGFPEVSAAQILETLDDMRSRYAVAGNGMNAVRLMEFYWARELGTADLDERYQAWITTPRDDYSQCQACEPGDRAAYLARHGRRSEAIDLIEATLATDPRCATEPADMLSVLTLAYLDEGRLDDARATYSRAVAELADTDGPMSFAHGNHVEFLARSGNADRAMRWLRDNEELLTGGAGVPQRTLRYLATVGHVTRLWIDQGLAEREIAFARLGRMSVAALHAWAWERAEPLAARFDARNGTSHRGEEIAAAFTQVAPVIPLDLSLAAHSSCPHGADDGPQAAFSRGEFAARRDPAVAAGHYLAASEGFGQAGDWRRAGLARAEAAHCLEQLGDLAGADETYTAALDLLERSGATCLARLPVEHARIGVRANADDTDGALAAIDACEASLVAQEPETSAERGLALLELGEARARVLASTGRFEEAWTTATNVAERMGSQGQHLRAASAALLAGQIAAVHLGRPEQAVAPLRQAFDAFSQVTNAKTQRLEAAALLVDALRSTGQDGEADAIADAIS